MLLVFVMCKQENTGYKNNKESQMNKTRVSYSIKDPQGYLVEVERTFPNDRSAIQFIRTLNSIHGQTITGKPLLEKVA